MRANKPARVLNSSVAAALLISLAIASVTPATADTVCEIALGPTNRVLGDEAPCGGLTSADVSTSPWRLVDVSCSGSATAQTQTKDTVKRVNLVFFEVTVVESKTTATYQYSYSCKGNTEIDVSGRGGFLRRVGMEYGYASSSTSLAGGVDLLSFDYQDVENECQYDGVTSFDCTVPHSQPALDLASEKGITSSLPLELNLCVVPDADGLRAYNRANHQDADLTAVVRPITILSACINGVRINWDLGLEEIPSPPTPVSRL
jgi:hypothetical protein